MRHVQDQGFNGPLDLLLQLIEQEDLDITQVSLSKVTEQYIAELQTMEELPIDELAEFLVVAAKLLLIKSRVLLPGEPIMDDAGYELERQLKMYKAFLEASKQVDRLYKRHRVAYPRQEGGAWEPIFNPPADLTPSGMEAMFHDIVNDLAPIIKLPQTVIIRTINIRQKIVQLKESLLRQPKMSFHQLLRQAVSRTEAIITFLAVLELVKQRSVTVVQREQHADMDIEALVIEEFEPVTITSV